MSAILKGTPAARSKALAVIMHALIEVAQKASETSGWEYVIDGTQCRRFGDNREIVIRLKAWSDECAP